MKTFEEVIDLIISKRSNMHWKHGGLVHIKGRAPDNKTECGIEMDASAYLYMAWENNFHFYVTCEACLDNAPSLMPGKDLLELMLISDDLDQSRLRIALGRDWKRYVTLRDHHGQP